MKRKPSAAPYRSSLNPRLLLGNEKIDKRRKVLNPPRFAHAVDGSNGVGRESQVLGDSLPVGPSSTPGGTALGFGHSARSVRADTELPSQKSVTDQKDVAVRAHRAHTPNHSTTLMPKASPKRTRPCKNILMRKDLSDFANEYFPLTGYKCLSDFVEAKLKQHARNEAKNIRKKGVKIPPICFQK